MTRFLTIARPGKPALIIPVLMVNGARRGRAMLAMLAAGYQLFRLRWVFGLDAGKCERVLACARRRATGGARTQLWGMDHVALFSKAGLFSNVVTPEVMASPSELVVMGLDLAREPRVITCDVWDDIVAAPEFSQRLSDMGAALQAFVEGQICDEELS